MEAGFETIKDRMLLYIHYKYLTVKEFSKRSGVRETSVYALGQTTPQHVYEKIYAFFPLLNPLWLQKGEGDMEKKYTSRGTYRIQRLELENNRLTELIEQKDGQITRLLMLLEAKEAAILKLIDIIRLDDL